MGRVCGQSLFVSRDVKRAYRTLGGAFCEPSAELTAYHRAGSQSGTGATANTRFSVVQYHSVRLDVLQYHFVLTSQDNILADSLGGPGVGRTAVPVRCDGPW